jgi:flagellar biosynthesis component FlhA
VETAYEASHKAAAALFRFRRYLPMESFVWPFVFAVVAGLTARFLWELGTILYRLAEQQSADKQRHEETEESAEEQQLSGQAVMLPKPYAAKDQPEPADKEPAA